MFVIIQSMKCDTRVGFEINIVYTKAYFAASICWEKKQFCHHKEKITYKQHDLLPCASETP